ncbi:GNAT family N-acetyltransferase [Kaistia dalseonensis]|uniref:RimJ/RimL family protein N-acetyltransferase n=1 Tax=Kaistia dalseonensis TaxID=410840 RepID=A0ABU0H4Q4_9HYPH|nr:GNAT family N-acetyltransferase [Kaistia dalseonensis]MCX5494684.1 GNAT family N-acetyltransferase [Kaistia dalseonensis]MDQ0437265.1 RimJ/RimL family protein N-acetyltransferase [Kaistia dalseonensis]
MMLTRAARPESRIETERLVLRPAELSDADAITAGLGDFEVTRWLARVPYPYDREEAERFLLWERRQRGSGNERVYIIDRDGPLGLISLRDFGRAPVLGYWIARPHWGKGYMTEAVGALVAETFANPAVLEIRSGVFEGNLRSLAVQNSYGFEITGHSVQHNLALGRDLSHIDTVLTRTRHLEFKS